MRQAKLKQPWIAKACGLAMTVFLLG